MSVLLFYWLHAHPYDFYRFTEFALAGFSALNGLKLLRLEPLGGVIEGRSSCQTADTHTDRKSPSGSLASDRNWTLGTLSLGQTHHQVSARQFPLGYFVIAQRPAIAN